MRQRIVVTLAGMAMLLSAFCALRAQVPTVAEIDKRFPLGDQLRVLADDASSPAYRKLVDEMLSTDLAAEWQRVETADNPESFLKRHGGRAKVLADPDLKRAYQRRIDIRKAFLDVMRAGYKRFNRVPPFDRGQKAEAAGTQSGPLAAADGELAIVPPAQGAARNWPRFRGPDGQGTSLTGPLPTKWSATENVLWQAALPGEGNSSPIIWGDRLFVTTAGEAGAERGLHCLRRIDGKLLWTRQVAPHQSEPNVRPKNGYASATPVTDGQRVIGFFGTAGLVCYDFAGKLLWQHPLPDMNTTHGTGASPLLYRDRVIFIHDQNRAASIMLALDKQSGEVLWQGERKKAMGWSTPVAVRVAGRDELLYAGGEQVTAYDPASGKLLWHMAGPTREVVPTLVIGPRLVYSASGRNGPTLGLRPGGSGDVGETHLAWRTVRGGPHVPSPALVDSRLFTVNDTGIASCLDAATGKLVWQARIRDRFSASPVVAGGLLYFSAESGVTYVLRAGDRFEIVAKNDIGAPLLASPAALDGKLYLRTPASVVCVGTAG